MDGDNLGKIMEIIQENDKSVSILNKTAEEPFDAFSQAFHDKTGPSLQNSSVDIDQLKKILKLDPEVGKMDKKCYNFLGEACVLTFV